MTGQSSRNPSVRVPLHYCRGSEVGGLTYRDSEWSGTQDLTSGLDSTDELGGRRLSWGDSI